MICETKLFFFCYLCWPDPVTVLQRKLPAPGFHVEIVMAESDNSTQQQPQSSSGADSGKIKSKQSRDDDVFSDSDGEEEGNSKAVDSSSTKDKTAGSMHQTSRDHQITEPPKTDDNSANRSITSSSSSGLYNNNPVQDDSLAVSNIKAIAADASVFSFGDEEEDYESDWAWEFKFYHIHSLHTQVKHFFVWTLFLYE